MTAVPAPIKQKPSQGGRVAKQERQKKSLSMKSKNNDASSNGSSKSSS